jgi:hypothetical protein
MALFPTRTNFLLICKGNKARLHTTPLVEHLVSRITVKVHLTSKHSTCSFPIPINLYTPRLDRCHRMRTCLSHSTCQGIHRKYRCNSMVQVQACSMSVFARSLGNSSVPLGRRWEGT